jgi:hypothetical protein
MGVKRCAASRKPRSLNKTLESPQDCTPGVPKGVLHVRGPQVARIPNNLPADTLFCLQDAAASSCRSLIRLFRKRSLHRQGHSVWFVQAGFRFRSEAVPAERSEA